MRSILLLPLALLTACGTLYSPPTDGPTANMRVVALNSEGYFALTRDVSQVCSRDSPNMVMLGGDTKGDPETLGMPGYVGPKNDRFERRIRASQPFAFTASSLRRVGFGEVVFMGSVAGQEAARQKAWACAVRVEFVPVANSHYEVTYDFAPGKCDVRVHELLGDRAEPSKRPVAVKTELADCALIAKGG